MARIGVIGAGVVGVSAAYLLAKAGHAVTLIDAAAEPGRGASAGNAAQLSWAYGDAMASPALLRHLPAIALGRDPAFRIRWQLDADFLLWGVKFLCNATPSRWWNNTQSILALAEQSRQELASLLEETDLTFDYRLAGKLHLYPDQQGLAKAGALVVRKTALGLEQCLLNRAEAEQVEPALGHYQAEIAGAVYTPGDALGDAAAFCRQLTEHMALNHRLTLAFGRKVAGFVSKGDKLVALRFDDHDALGVDAAIVCAGLASRPLAHELPELRQIRPVRGYSLTVARSPVAPIVSLTDVKRKLAFASIGDRFRVAGMADIERPGSGFDPARFEALRSGAAEVLPHFFEGGDDLMRWSGERPMTPFSRPIIRPSSRVRGIYINAGHGMLGWTLALGSARRIADMVGC